MECPLKVKAIVVATHTANLAAIAEATTPVLGHPASKVLNGNKRVNPSDELDRCVQALVGHKHTNDHGVITVLVACDVHAHVMDVLHGARVSCRAMDAVMIYVITAFKDQWKLIIEMGKQGDSWEVFEAIEGVIRCS